MAAVFEGDEPVRIDGAANRSRDRRRGDDVCDVERRDAPMATRHPPAPSLDLQRCCGSPRGRVGPAL